MINDYAKKALRTIVLAYKDVQANEGGPRHNFPEEEELKDIEKSGLTLITILGIRDVVRPEVPKAVEDCKKAGVTVRMVTGDNIVTAKAIAVNCGIISEAEKDIPGICVEGPEFYEAMGGLKNKGKKDECVANMKEF